MKPLKRSGNVKCIVDEEYLMEDCNEIHKEYIPFGKPNFSDEEINAVTQIMRSGWVGMGPETIAFENELAQHINVPYVVTVNSCTSALFLSLLIHGVKPGDEVICPSFTWCATANVILYLRARPIFCDVDPETLCVTPELILEKLTPKTKAVIIVHFGGLAVDVGKVRNALPKHIAVVEDAAHAFGSCYPNGQMVGTSENLTCFSFYANKNLSTGEGGAIALFDKEQAEHLKCLRQNALSVDAWKRYSHPRSLIISNQLSELGYKMNYTDLQASIGRVQLKRQRIFQATRLRIAQRYYEDIGRLFPSIGFQRNCLDPGHSKHLFIILLPVENLRLSNYELLRELKKRNVGAGLHYVPLHLMELYRAGINVCLPTTEETYKRILTLPISASMNIEEAVYVIAQIKDLLMNNLSNRF